MQLLGHDRGARSPRCLGHRAETSTASSSQAARRALTICSTIYYLPECSDAIVVVSAYLPGRHESVPVALDERVLVYSLASGATSGIRPRALLALLRPTARRRPGWSHVDGEKGQGNCCDSPGSTRR